MIGAQIIDHSCSAEVVPRVWEGLLEVFIARLGPSRRDPSRRYRFAPTGRA